MEQAKERPDYEVARDELRALLEAAGLTMSAEPTTRERSSFDKYAGHYRCAFSARPCTSEGVRWGAAEKTHTVTYSVGCGILAAFAAKGSRPGASIGWGWNARDFKAPLWKPGRLSNDQADALPRIAKAYRPDVADVFSSLLLDTSEWEADMSFREWCATDLAQCDEKANHADALDTYEEIRATARFLQAVFTPDELQRAREIAGRL